MSRIESKGQRNGISTINPMMKDVETPINKYVGETPLQKRANKIGAAVLIGIMIFVIFLAIGFDVPESRYKENENSSPTPTPVLPDLQRTVFVHLFEWKWTDIEKECVNFLGPKGFSAVQVSPVNEHIDPATVNLTNPDVGSFMPWWARYQPVSYKLESRSGTRAELISMIKTCKSVGVDIYVDILFNHMAATETIVGNAGTPFNPSTLSYADYNETHFNSCVPQEIQQDDWANNATRVRRCRLVGLPDLNHDLDYVKQTLIKHAQDLMDIGVSGLRLDAGKHMYVDDVNELLNGVTGGEFYVFSEIIDYGSESISVLEYTPYYDITEFRYEGTMNDRFTNYESKLATLEDIGVKFDFVDPTSAVVFTDNHDSQRHTGHLNFKDENTYSLANIFMLAHPYGYPKLMSSFFFNDGEFARGPPSDPLGNTKNVYNQDGSDVCGEGEWICEHRNIQANMVGFRNYATTVGAFEVFNWWSNGADAISFSRKGPEGVAGFVAINFETTRLTQTFNTGLPDGNYCNVLSGDIGENQECTGGDIVTVKNNGFLTVTMNAKSALAIYGIPAI